MLKPEYCVFDHIDARGEPVAKLYRDRLEFAAAAEDAGFAAYYIAEHHCTPLGHAASPNVLLAAFAQRTSRIRIGSMVHVLPAYDPLRLYEELCMLDHLSGGRLDVGVGRGASPFETSMFGIVNQQSRFIFEEALDVIKAAMTSDVLSHRGEFFKYYDVPLTLKPLQAGGPPMFYGAFSERNLEFAATKGLNITLNGPPARLRTLREQYLELWATRQPLAPRPKIACLYQIFVGETDAEAERIASSAFDSWYQSMTHLWRANNASPRDTLPTSFARAAQMGSYIAGSAATVRQRLNDVLQISGIERLLLQCNMGDMPHSAAVESIQRFQQAVMPFVHVSANGEQPISLAS